MAIWEYLLTIVKLKALYIATKITKNKNTLKFDIFGLKTIITPLKPIIIAIQLMKLSFSFKTNLAQIKRKKELSHISLIKQSRLSVMPIDPKSWKLLCKMGGLKL